MRIRVTAGTVVYFLARSPEGRYLTQGVERAEQFSTFEKAQRIRESSEFIDLIENLGGCTTSNRGAARIVLGLMSCSPSMT